LLGIARKTLRSRLRELDLKVTRTVEPDDVSDSVDSILDKISKSGMSSLTENEKRQLERARDRLSVKARARLETGLVAGDPGGEVTIAWTIAQQVMALYQLDDPAQARARAAELMTALRTCPIPELARLGRTLHIWRDELVAQFDHPSVSNGPTENLNLKIKNTKRIARGYRNFGHYRLRLLLNHGRIREDHSPTRIRTRAPRFAA